MVKGTGREFMEKTKYEHLDRSDQVKGLPQPPLTLPPAEGKPVHRLPDPGEAPRRALDLWDAINNRVSIRAYGEEPLSLEELSYLLWCTQGVKDATNRPATLRTVPSAGARHCFETYVLVNRVEGLRRGLYRFLATKHRLQEVDTDPGIAERITQACFNQHFVMQSAATFIWTAVAYRIMWRYGERGYRYMHLDAGHVCQNLYLAAEAVGCGACAIGAFYDDALNEALQIDGVEQFAVYVGVLGKKRD